MILSFCYFSHWGINFALIVHLLFEPHVFPKICRLQNNHFIAIKTCLLFMFNTIITTKNLHKINSFYFSMQLIHIDNKES